MCGIFGFIGESKNPAASFELANNLMIATEKRGTDATGFWGCENIKDGRRLFFDKEPVKSSLYKDTPIWKKEFAVVNSDLLLGHCRATSQGVGTEKINRNNHPHVSSDKKIALVHNGKIADYQILKDLYHLRSDCDSEVLLSMFESCVRFDTETVQKEYPDVPGYIARRMAGLREIFKYVNDGAWAVAIGERDDSSARRLWLFRNKERPLTVINLMGSLGQLFFCSTPEIWVEAFGKSPLAKAMVPGDHDIVELGEDHFWLFDFDATRGENPWYIKKYKVSRSKYTESRIDDDRMKFERFPKDDKPSIQVVSRLDVDESIKGGSTTYATSPCKTQGCDDQTQLETKTPDDNKSITKDQVMAFNNEVEELKKSLKSLESCVAVLFNQNLITDNEMKTVIEQVMECNIEIKAMIKSINKTGS